MTGNGVLACAACGHAAVFIHADVMDEIVEHAREDTRREIGGVLLGWFYQCQGELVTDAQHAGVGTCAGGARDVPSHDTWAHINGEGSGVPGAPHRWLVP